jgi:Zn2+/Cd2+-exporting ATPase
VADELCGPSRAVVEQLHRLGIERVVMFSGDHERVAEAIGNAACRDEWRAGLLPHDKSVAVAELGRSAGPVAMVGDGINDHAAPALVADVGVAMGAGGTSVTMEIGDVALMSDELDKLPAAIRLARRAMRIVKANVALSLVSIAALFAAALAGWAQPHHRPAAQRGDGPTHHRQRPPPAAHADRKLSSPRARSRHSPAPPPA